MNCTKVIAISGASGAGKTTIVRLLAAELNCPFLLFDDHTNQDTYPINMKVWLENGANVDLIKTPKFVTALQALIADTRCRYIFIEEPFGRERNAMANLVDYVVLLEQPLALCLARIIKRHADFADSSSLNLSATFLDKYHDHMRDVYISAVNQVSSNCDLIINEVSPIKATTQFIIHWLNSLK